MAIVLSLRPGEYLETARIDGRSRVLINRNDCLEERLLGTGDAMALTGTDYLFGTQSGLSKVYMRPDTHKVVVLDSGMERVFFRSGGRLCHADVRVCRRDSTLAYNGHHFDTYREVVRHAKRLL